MGRPDTSSAHRRSLAGFLARNLSSLFARFRQANGDCLLSASHSSALPAFARSQGSVFATPHGTGHALLRTRSISRHFSASFAAPTLAGNTAATAVRPNFLYASPGASSEVSVGSLRKAYERGYLRGFAYRPREFPEPSALTVALLRYPWPRRPTRKLQPPPCGGVLNPSPVRRVFNIAAVGVRQLTVMSYILYPGRSTVWTLFVPNLFFRFQPVLCCRSRCLSPFQKQLIRALPNFCISFLVHKPSLVS